MEQEQKNILQQKEPKIVHKSEEPIHDNKEINKNRGIISFHSLWLVGGKR